MIGRLIRQSVKSVARLGGFEVVEAARLYDWQTQSGGGRSYARAQLPPGAAEHLRTDSPRLLDLKQRYARVDAAVRNSLVWTDDYLKPDDLTYFRGDNPYVYQLRGRNMNELSYMVSYYAAKSADQLAFFDRLEEDHFFGIHTFTIDQRLVSRDLLDSISELNFLERHLGISQRPDVRMLDIGAGYGRLAHRATTAIPSVKSYLCADAIPESSFVCEFYLGYRRVNDRARMVPLDEVENAVEEAHIEVAVNVHSFSECSLEAIDWWIALLKRNKVPRLMVVPNIVAADGVTMLTNTREDFTQIVHAAGYRLLANEPKYLDPMVQKYGINPARYFLFGLQ